MVSRNHRGPVRGGEHRDDDGRAAGKPIVIVAAIGTVDDILGVDDRPRFRTDGRGMRHAFYAYDGDPRVGTVLPSAGVRLLRPLGEYSPPAAAIPS